MMKEEDEIFNQGGLTMEDYTPDYIDSLLPDQIFVFGSNILGYHAGGASKLATRKFGAVWGQPEGLQGQSYAIPTDHGDGVRNDIEVKAAVERFIAFAKEHEKLFFLVTRIGCGTAGYKDDEIAKFFKEALDLKNVSLPRSFVNALKGESVFFDLDRFVDAQQVTYEMALHEIENGKKRGHWIWYIFPQIKGLGHSSNSEFYGISCKEEAQAYWAHPVLSERLREITQALLDCDNPRAEDIFGYPDVKKVKSCMTLFDLVSPNDIFESVLNKYYDGMRCEKTLKRLTGRDEKVKNAIRVSQLTITKDYKIILSDLQREIVMEPIVKAVYLLFLNHPEGIVFKRLPEYRKELAEIYEKIKPHGLTERAKKSIEDVTNPLLNSINEKCARIRAAFMKELDEEIAKSYFITGERGEVKKISLPREFVVCETEI